MARVVTLPPSACALVAVGDPYCSSVSAEPPCRTVSAAKKRGCNASVAIPLGPSLEFTRVVLVWCCVAAAARAAAGGSKGGGPSKKCVMESDNIVSLREECV